MVWQTCHFSTRAVLQVALKGLSGERGGRQWGRETGRRTGSDVNMKEKVEGVGVGALEEPGNKSFLFIWVIGGSLARFRLLVG